MAKRSKKISKQLTNHALYYGISKGVVCTVWAKMPEGLTYQRALDAGLKFDWPKMDRIKGWMDKKVKDTVIGV